MLHPVRPSVCPSVCFVTTSIYSKSEKPQKVQIWCRHDHGHEYLGSKLKVKRSKVKVTRNKNVKLVFRAHHREKWIDIHQTNTKMIYETTIVKCILTAETGNFCDICLCFESLFLRISQNRAPLFYFASHTDAIVPYSSWIAWLRKQGISLKFSARWRRSFLIRDFLTVHPNSAANRTWSAFVPFYVLRAYLVSYSRNQRAFMFVLCNKNFLTYLRRYRYNYVRRGLSCFRVIK